jgi:hypothetical protein
VNRLILDNVSSGSYQPRPFQETAVFRALVAGIASQAGAVPLTDLATKGHLDSKLVASLAKLKISTVAQLFGPPASYATSPDAAAAQRAILDSLLKTKKA